MWGHDSHLLYGGPNGIRENSDHVPFLFFEEFFLRVGRRTRSREPEVLIGARRQLPSPDRPFEKPDPHQEGLVGGFDGVLFLVDRRGDGGDPDRTSPVVLDNGEKNLAVYL